MENCIHVSRELLCLCIHWINKAYESLGFHVGIRCFHGRWSENCLAGYCPLLNTFPWCGHCIILLFIDGENHWKLEWGGHSRWGDLDQYICNICLRLLPSAFLGALEAMVVTTPARMGCRLQFQVTLFLSILDPKGSSFTSSQLDQRGRKLWLNRGKLN